MGNGMGFHHASEIVNLSFTRDAELCRHVKKRAAVYHYEYWNSHAVAIYPMMLSAKL